MLSPILLQELESYVQQYQEAVVLYALPEASEAFPAESIREMELAAFIEQNRRPSLQQVLFQFIDRSGARDSEIYRRAGLDRKHFSKIRSNPDYRPRKNTLMALAFALKLGRSDTDLLLGAAGYALSDSDTYDLVLQFCLERDIYELDDINAALHHFQLKPLVEHPL